MHIALISDWFSPRKGGIESHLLGLGGALMTAGHRVTALTAQPRAAAADLPVIALPLRHIPTLDLAWPFGLQGVMARHLAQLAPDLVHVHASIVAPACFAGVQAALALGLPVVITFHSDLRMFRAALPLLRAWQGRVLFSAVSAPIAAQLGAALGGRAMVLPNGFDYGFWAAPPAARQDDRQSFHIVSALRLTRKKRPLVLAQMARAVAKATGRPVKLTIAGSGTARLTRALAPVADLCGWLSRDDLRAIYHQADLFVQPAKFESFGIAAIEARAAGLPVIGRAGTGLGDFITDGQDGALCPSDRAMVDAAITLARNPDLLARQSGPRPALARFDWPQVAALHEQVYAAALAKAPSISRARRN